MNEKDNKPLGRFVDTDGDDDIIEIRPRRRSRSVEGSGAQRKSAGSRQTRSSFAPQSESAPRRAPAASRTPPNAGGGTRTYTAGQSAEGRQPNARRENAPRQTIGGSSTPVRRQTSIPADQTRYVPQDRSRPEIRDVSSNPRPSASRPVSSQDPARRQSGGRHSVGSGRTSKKQKRKTGKLSAGIVILRSLLVLFTILILVVGIVFAVVFVIAHGPSETARDKAVMSAMQASATKWVPGLFLSEETVNRIIENSTVVITDVKPITDVNSGEDAPAAVTEDRWENAIDGMILEFINGKTFKGYVLFIKDPSRVSVAIKDKSFASASRVFEIVEQYGAVAAINGGEFPDNGVTTLSNPIGLTYSQGECVWNDNLPRTFIGFTKDNKLFVEEGTNKARADEVGIRDAVAFQEGNTLITNDGENVTYYYADSNTGVAQRTAIGQLADGTVMFLVTDGRTAQSLGATKNDIIDTFVKYGAVTAGLLDGGSSALMWYRDWYNKYNVDESGLDNWQKMGLVNIYKAFTNPRAIPTYFIVK